MNREIHNNKRRECEHNGEGLAERGTCLKCDSAGRQEGSAMEEEDFVDGSRSSLSPNPTAVDTNGSIAQPDGHAAPLANTPPAEPEASRSKLQTAIIMASLCSSVFLAALDVSIVTTALPTISEHFHSDAGYTWIGSAYLLANAASAP